MNERSFINFLSKVIFYPQSLDGKWMKNQVYVYFSLCYESFYQYQILLWIAVTKLY
ncbi:hypothetical protein BvCmsHHNP033_00402 [Escherichia coli]|nr:hypothetical protein BvCmsHHNP033_00402 [Escherichia coli]